MSLPAEFWYALKNPAVPPMVAQVTTACFLMPAGADNREKVGECERRSQELDPGEAGGEASKQSPSRSCLTC